MPRLPKEYTIVMGHIMTAQEVKTAYQVDEVCYADEMPERLGKLTADPTLLLLNGTNSDSGKGTRPAAFDGKTNLLVSLGDVLLPMISTKFLHFNFKHL